MLILEAKENGGSPRRIANLVFFAVHPTVLIHNAPLFNSDFTGYAMDALESKTSGLVAGFFNGAEGDITPRRFYRDILEVEKRGKQFLKSVETVLREPVKYVLEPPILLRARLINTRSSADRNCEIKINEGKINERKITGRLAERALVFPVSKVVITNSRPFSYQL